MYLVLLIALVVLVVAGYLFMNHQLDKMLMEL